MGLKAVAVCRCRCCYERSERTDEQSEEHLSCSIFLQEMTIIVQGYLHIFRRTPNDNAFVVGS